MLKSERVIQYPNKSNKGGGIAQKHGVTNPQLCKSGKLHAGQNQEQTVISPAAAWGSVAKKCCHG